MKYIVKITSTCPEGAVERIRHILCNDDNELEDILALNNESMLRYRSYSFVGVVEQLDKCELEYTKTPVEKIK